MTSDSLMRRVFWAAAATNLGGALLFAFPDSPPGQWAGLPADAPLLYRAMVALFVLLLGGMYAWLAREPVFTRPLIWLGAIGKTGAALCVVALWLAAAAPLRSVLVIGVDLLFAALFLRYLLRGQPDAA